MKKRTKAIILAITILASMQLFSGAVMAAEQVGSIFESLLVIFNMDTVEKDGVIYNPIHVYTGIDSLDYKNVGFEMQAINDSTNQTKENSSSTVYESMKVIESNGTKKTYTAGDLGGNYMFGHELLFTADKWSNKDTEIRITPYAVKLDGTKITGAQTILTDAIIKAANPDSALFKELSEKFKASFENTDLYLYRVGNANPVALKSLFKALGDVVIDSSKVNIEILNRSGDVSGSLKSDLTDWNLSTIQFTGTGIVTITIKESESLPFSLDLEVVNAKNVTTYSELTPTRPSPNSVLLNDINIIKGGQYSLSNAVLYGNGFTFDVTDGGYEGNRFLSNNYLINLTNARLDNIKITGAVYTEYGATAQSNYNRPLILSTGNNTITNCYMSNCASPIRVLNGALEIVNSTLKGGNFANLDIRGGNIILDNVTTINQINANDKAENGTTVAGLGIVFYYENVLDTTTLEIRNGIKQYNYISKAQADKYLTNTAAKSLVNVIYSSDLKNLQYENGQDKWVNMGILSLTETVGHDNISDIDNYKSATASLMGTTGFVYTIIPDEQSISYEPSCWKASSQYEIAPDFSFDYTSKNYIPKTEGSNKFCYENEGTVLISFDEGDFLTWDTSIMTAAKAGKSLEYTVVINGKDYTGKEIVFDTSGEYIVKYTCTDSNNYRITTDGSIETYDKTYVKNIHIKVSVIKASAKSAEFVFGADNTPSRKVTVGNKTYIMPDVDTTSNKIASKTISGTTIYFPIVEMVTSDGKTSHSGSWFGYFPILKDAVTIKDYADSGTGNPIIYDASTTEMPPNLSLVGDPSIVFKYQSSSSAPPSYQIQKGMLVYSSPSLSGVNRTEQNIDAEYSYTDNMGITYNYIVRYHCAEQKKDSCFAEGTLITLADGNKKRIEDITYDDQILAWDFFSGKYVPTKPSLLLDYGTENKNIINLKFDDGTDLRFILWHGLFDIETNNYIYIDETNVASYIGHSFVKTEKDEYGNYFNSSAKLIDYNITEEKVGCYSILTSKYNNCIAENMLTVTPPPQEHWYDYFEIDNNMKYDNEKMKADIEKYGLYDYNVISDYLTYDEFIAFNVPYLKILEGKGYIKFEDIITIIARYGIGTNN